MFFNKFIGKFTRKNRISKGNKYVQQYIWGYFKW